MGDRSRRATYTPPTDQEPNKRATISERPAGKADRARASTLLALGLADEKAQALSEASLLSADVDNTEAITTGNYTVLILGTDLAAKKPGKAFTVCNPRTFFATLLTMSLAVLLHKNHEMMFMLAFTLRYHSEKLFTLRQREK